MPTLNRAAPSKELEHLIKIYLKAETDIINEIARLRSEGNVDYHAVAALERVQAILRSMENETWKYAPKMVEKQFYVIHPEKRRIEGETVQKHLMGYGNAAALTSEQHAIVDQLVNSLMGEITDASLTALANVQSALIGRIEPDIYRRVGLEQVALQQATGADTYKMLRGFVETLRREGVTAFVDKAGRKWSLHTYCSMVSRTTSRQAETMALLTSDLEQDLYQITKNGTTCGICAAYEGRVYSRSGLNPNYPKLSDAFGKQDPTGADTLANTWLNLHPNCLHSLVPFNENGYEQGELKKIRDYSNPVKNPYTVDPRSKKQVEAYRKKETARRRWLADYRQWENYRSTVGSPVPKTFETWQKHKAAGDDKYKEWQMLYRAANRGS